MIFVASYIRQVTDFFGREKQMVKAAEECSELGQQCCKAALNLANRAELIEETADVLLMIEQIKKFYAITDTDINQMMQWKMQRTLDKIADLQKQQSTDALMKIGARREAAGKE